MQIILISDILVHDRQRKDLGDLDRDFASVKEIGLIQPIVLDCQELDSAPGLASYSLIAGGRRLEWLKKNGYTELFHGASCDPKRPGYILATEQSERTRQEAELLENIKRHNLNWMEECRAIARVHRLRWLESKDIEWGQVHTARLLNIADKSRVSYALMIADELTKEPEGEMSKCENYAVALKMIFTRAEQEARAEQDKRREILRKIEERMLPGNEEGNIQVIPRDIGDEIFEPETEKQVVWLSHMLYHGDFNTIAETDFPPDIYPCAMVFGEDNSWIVQTYRLLREHAFTIWCSHNYFREEFNPFQRLLQPVIWNVLGLAADEEKPFKANLEFIMALVKGNPRSPCPSATSVVSANFEEGKWPPLPVIAFLLQAVSSPGDSILLPRGGPVDIILNLSRRPICFESDSAQHEKNVEMAKTYYKNLYCDNVEFK